MLSKSLQYAFALFNVFNSVLSGVSESNLLPSKDVCGQFIEDRIYGGEMAAIGQFPWVSVLMNKMENEKSKFWCGGVLINSRYVLTAANCMSDNITSVRLGEHDIRTELDCEGDVPALKFCSDPPVDVEIEQQIIHENYDADLQADIYDIALLRLKDGVNYTEFIQPICLPLSSDLQANDFNGERMTVVGWAQNKHSFRNDVKRKVEVKVESNQEYASAYKKLGQTVVGSQICAGGKVGKDSCFGDGGGPLMYKHKTDIEVNWMVVGIVSSGPEKCEPDIPGIYTRVTDYIPWILNNLKP